MITEAGRVQRRLGGVVEDYGLLGPSLRPVLVQPYGGPLLVLTHDGVYELRDSPVLRTDLPADATAVIEDGAATFVQRETGSFLRAEPGASWMPADPEDALARVGALQRQRFEGTPFTVTSAGIPLDGVLVVPLVGNPTDLLVHDGDVWISTTSDGLLRLRRTPLRVHLPGGDSARVDQVTRDGVTGAIWIGAGGVQPMGLGMVPLTADGARWWWAAGSLHRQLSPDGASPLVLGDAESPACRERLMAVHIGAGGSVVAGTGLRRADGAWEALPGFCGDPFGYVQAMLDLGGSRRPEGAPPPPRRRPDLALRGAPRALRAASGRSLRGRVALPRVAGGARGIGRARLAGGRPGPDMDLHQPRAPRGGHERPRGLRRGGAIRGAARRPRGALGPPARRPQRHGRLLRARQGRRELLVSPRPAPARAPRPGTRARGPGPRGASNRLGAGRRAPLPAR